MSKTCPVCATSYEDTSVFCPRDGSTLLSDEAATDLVGTVIADRYKITKLLGEGGMGRVYLAEHVRLPQKAAIKVLHPGMVKDNDAVQRFNREAANAAKIEHDRVARVMDFGTTRDGLVYIAMEFVPGRTIRAILHDEGTLTPARAANLTYQIAEGLDAAHRIGIVHRDLKPDNILVTTDDQGMDRSKVVDFGIAKSAVGGATETQQLTRTGMVVGTPEFMSPEQVLGEPLDARSDVYALALVAYQMLTGMLPFAGTTPERSLTARLIEDPRPLALAAPQTPWPAAVQAALDHALAREPEQRTATAMEFADALVAATEAWTGAPVLRTRTPLSTASMTASASAQRTTSPTPANGPTASFTPAVARKAVSTDERALEASRTPSRTRLPMMIGGGVLVAAVAVYVAVRLAGGASADTATLAAPRALPNAPATTTSSSAPSGAAGASMPTAAAPATSNASGVAPPSNGAVSPTVSPTVSPRPSSTDQAPPPVGSGAAGARDASAQAASAAAVAAQSPSAPSPASLEARRRLDAIRKELEDVSDQSAALIGGEDAPRLRALLPDLSTRADSALTYLTLVIAYGYADRIELACAALRSASALVATPAQRDMLRTMTKDESLKSCRP